MLGETILIQDGCATTTEDEAGTLDLVRAETFALVSLFDVVQEIGIISPTLTART